MNPASLSRRDLRRFVKDLWADSRCIAHARTAVDVAAGHDAQSLDRAILSGYLRHFPRKHPDFEHLRAATQYVADRRDWAWKAHGQRWALWDADEAPVRLANAMLQGVGTKALREAGLEGDLAQGELVHQAVIAACMVSSKSKADEAQRFGESLIDMFDAHQIVGREGILAYGLLAPWQDKQPDKDYRKHIGGILIRRIGDPRIEINRWQALRGDLLEYYGLDLAPAVHSLKLWLTEAAFEAFFKIVSASTDRPDQWEQREAFWRGYLDGGSVRDAWFAFGKQAEGAAADLARAEDVQYGRIEGTGASPTQTALILSVGDLRIAEWSDNGATRFWDDQDNTAPGLYKSTYFGATLRAMNGGRDYTKGFAAIPHMSGWQRKFAAHIFRITGIRHPRWGEGVWTESFY